MGDVLTCAISETNKTENYKVIYYDFQTRKFNEEEIPNQEFYDENGDVVWDLFHITDFQKDGKSRLKGSYSTNEMISFFKQHLIPISRFYSEKPKYAIVKINSVQQVSPPQRSDSRIQCRLDFLSNGKRYRNKLNKDFRWINYWNRTPEQSWANKCRKWESYLNNRNNSVYAVMYTHQFRNGWKSQWIAGFHCLTEREG